MGKKLLKVHKVDLSNEPIQYQWYVVKTQFNYEQKAADNIMTLAKNRGYGDQIVEVIVPIIESVETVIDKEGKPKKRKKRTKVWGLDGYIWIKMVMTNETWGLVRNATGVAGWLSRDGRPLPLEDWEIAKIKESCQYQPKKEKIDLDVNVGDTIKISEGTMQGFEGKVVEIQYDKQILKLENEHGFKVEVDFQQVQSL